MIVIKNLILVVLVAVAAVVSLGAAYVALVLYHEHRWREIKSDKFDQYNEQQTGDNGGDIAQRVR